MKRVCVTMLILAAITSFSFADEGEQATTSKKIITEYTLKTADPDQVTGTVSCVLPADLTRPRSKLVITDESGNEIEFIAKALIVVYDETGRMLSLCGLQQGMKVQVNYRTTCNGLEATSVKLLK